MARSTVTRRPSKPASTTVTNDISVELFTKNPPEIAAEIIARARAAAFNEFMDAMGKQAPEGSLRAYVWLFQAAWNSCGEQDAEAVYGAKEEVAAGSRAEEIQGIQTQLFEANGVVHAVRRSILCNEYAEEEVSDTTRLQNALEVASRMIVAAASRLEGFDHE